MKSMSEKWSALRERLHRELGTGPGLELTLDSMEVMTLLQAVEGEVNVELSFMDVRNCRTFDDLEELIRERLR